MSDSMKPVPFGRLLKEILFEYAQYGTVLGVPFCRDHSDLPVGPAAGPHTQLAGNIAAAWAAGASVFELKTVQKLYGKDLHIAKPCIYSGPAKDDAVYNVEWSSEFAPDVCLSEYIKASLLLRVLARELPGIPEYHTSGPADAAPEHCCAPGFRFVMSVGYDLQGIQSEPVDSFIEGMKNAAGTKEWQNDTAWLKNNISLFKQLTKHDIDAFAPEISDSVTLSTMHGCKSSWIEKIASYLLQEKDLNVRIKMNPTLAGYEQVKGLLKSHGYDDVKVCADVFESDLKPEEAAELIPRLQKTAKRCGKVFGVKMTNTLPVKIRHGELAGERMYLSGVPLFPIAAAAALEIASVCDGRLPVSFSGGVTPENISEILSAGFSPVTVSSLLLQPGGYKNITRLLSAAAGFRKPNIRNGQFIDLKQLEKLALYGGDEKKQEPKVLKKATETARIRYPVKKPYSSLCAVCRNCQDVCPNRANIRLHCKGKDVVVHRDRLCNECGNCAYYCIMGHVPYREKLAFYENPEDFKKCSNEGVFPDGDTVVYRKNGKISPIPDEVKSVTELAEQLWAVSDFIGDCNEEQNQNSQKSDSRKNDC